MILVTISKAAGMPLAPTRQALYKQLETAEEKQTPRPKYFVDDRGKVKIDIDHPDWIAYLDECAKKKGIDTQPKEPDQKPLKGKNKKQLKNKNNIETLAAGGDLGGLLNPEQITLLRARSNIAFLEEQILKNDGVRYLNEKKKIALKKEAGELIETKLAEFLYLGYMEKVNVELLGLCKKIEPMIDNLVKKGDTKGVVSLFNRNFENILTEIKKAQADDLQAWEDGE